MTSIITITYNAGESLRPTLESIQSQTFGDYEHIIIDGASKDDTLAIAEEYPDKRRKVYSEPDKGLYDAMNKGLRKATGEYVLFLNAGDSFHDKDVLTDYARLAGKDVDIIYADTFIVDGDRNVTGKRHLSVPKRLTRKSFSNGMLVCHQAFMMRREKAPEYDLQYRFSADYDWTVKCLGATDASRCRNVGRFCIDYLSDGMTDKNHKASLKERFIIMSKHYGWPVAIGKHIWFLFRAASRKIRKP